MATPTFFPKINFSQIKNESRRSSGGAREKCRSTQGHATTLPTLNDYPKGEETMHGPYGHRRLAQDPYVIGYASKERVKEKRADLHEHP